MNHNQPNSSQSNQLSQLKENISKENEIVKELTYLFNHLESAEREEEKKMVLSQIKKLENFLKNTNDNIAKNLEKIFLVRPLKFKEEKISLPVKTKPVLEKEKKVIEEKILRKYELPKKWKELTQLEREVIKRIKKKEGRTIGREIKKPSKYIQLSNRFFSEFSKSLAEKEMFKPLEKDLRKTNLEFTIQSYISVMFFTLIISAGIAMLIFLPLLFISFEEFPAIAIASDIPARLLKFIWIIFVIPMGTFAFLYLYPSAEKKSLENGINQELPFATIHMSAISGSMIEPSKIFNIIITTKEYPNLEKEFTKLINLVNVYGYDLVTALKNIAINNPSKKLADLLNSLATTITSGGGLPDFFEKRAQSLLFEYRLEREKYTKTAETFMDIYISVVIAAPMIFMLLLVIMRVSGLGIPISSTMIALIIIFGVSMMNVFFLIFLNLKQPRE